ncbi:MAG: helix-turn-helix domain-containing protein [Candidatus Helarchaeota archaeon]|nr:helix-turn-helix domain-containing protein [Candidatus Helarchaeota archaeon]
MSDVMTAKFAIQMPTKLWIAALSKKYPEITFEILSILPTEKMIGNALVKITGDNAEKILQEITVHPSSLELHLISDLEKSKIFNVKTNDPWLLISLIKSEVILKMPVLVKNGIASWEILAPHEKISKFNDLLKEKNIKFQLKSIGKYKEEPQLTVRQTEVLDQAVKMGYYEIPRKITLTALAKKLNIAKSTLSGILRRIDKKLIQN